ncbi:MAG: ATP-binding cassette domain-containing protein [Firmicutes bacterium]|nr:ATP-binding cassette domain-containing protein [Bacillota bacterium]
MIEVKRLCKSFGPLKAVDDISFSCQPGEVFGLLGENGAGKTTTLRMLATILRPTSGTAIVAGHDLVQSPHMVRRQIGVLSTEPGLYDRLTVREMLRYYGELHDMPLPEISRRSEELIEMLDMKAYADRRTGKLSRGMKQKAAIARALLHDPPVLLLDEPTTGLDVVSARTVVNFIQQLRASGKCIVFSSHIMGEVEKVCDRVGIVHRGRLVACGTLDEVTETGQGELEDIFVRLVGAQE